MDSALKRVSTLPGLVILGELSIQGNIKALRSLAEAIQLGMENVHFSRTLLSSLSNGVVLDQSRAVDYWKDGSGMSFRLCSDFAIEGPKAEIIPNGEENGTPKR